MILITKALANEIKDSSRKSYCCLPESPAPTETSGHYAGNKQIFELAHQNIMQVQLLDTRSNIQNPFRSGLKWSLAPPRCTLPPITNRTLQNSHTELCEVHQSPTLFITLIAQLTTEQLRSSLLILRLMSNMSAASHPVFHLAQHSRGPHRDQTELTESTAVSITSYIGYVETTIDALRLVTACRLGLIPESKPPAYADYRPMAPRSGETIVHSLSQSGRIDHWNDRISWTTPTVEGNFNIYRQRRPGTLIGPGTSGNDETVDSGKNLIMKRVINLTFSETDYEVVCYYRENDLSMGILRRPACNSEIASLEIPADALQNNKLRFPLYISEDDRGRPFMFDDGGERHSKRPRAYVWLGPPENAGYDTEDEKTEPNASSTTSPEVEDTSSTSHTLMSPGPSMSNRQRRALPETDETDAVGSEDTRPAKRLRYILPAPAPALRNISGEVGETSNAKFLPGFRGIQRLSSSEIVIWSSPLHSIDFEIANL